MGIFSSKYVTTVGTVVSRVIDNDKIIGAVKKGSLKAILQDGNLADHVLEEMVTGIGVKAERMYTYAENHYIHGLPSGEVYSSTQGRQQVEAVIEALEGQQVLMEYSNFGPANALHLGWLKLVNVHGYNQATNQIASLSAQKGKPVYLKNLVVVVPSNLVSTLDPSVLETWGTAASGGYTPEAPANELELAAATPYVVSTTATEMYVLATYVWKASTSIWGNVAEETLSLSIAEYPSDPDYFQAKYLVNGQAKYWIYQNDTGGYPALDAVFVDAPVENGNYFPFTYFRYNKQSTISDKTTQAYKTSKRLVKYLGIDYDLLADTIDENPDIADVEQAMMVFGVPAVSTNSIECRYLFDYFNAMHYAMEPTTSNSRLDAIAQRFLFSHTASKNSVVIQDKQFKMAFGNDGISKRMVAGSIGTVGSYSSGYESIDLPEHFYRHQVAPGLYEEVRVINLKMTYYVYGNYSTTGDETDAILLVPIDRSISSQYSMGDREILYSRSLHFVFNSRTVTKLKWYQTGVFQVILLIIAVVIAMYDGGWTLSTVLSAAGIQALVTTIIINIVVGELLKVAFKLFVKAFGADVAKIIAIVAILYGGYQAFKAGSISGAPWAKELLAVSSGLTNAAMASDMADLMDEANAFRLFAEDKNELLEKANKLLSNSTALSPFVVFGEAPEDFYNRTVHSGNIGILGINAISSYVDIALTLPTLNDSLGEEIYAT